MSAAMLVDTDVLAWLAPGHVGAAQHLHRLNHRHISTVKCIEFALRCRDMPAPARLAKGLAVKAFRPRT